MKWSMDEIEKEGVSTHMSGFSGLDWVTKCLVVITSGIVIGTVVAIIVAYTMF